MSAPAAESDSTVSSTTSSKGGVRGYRPELDAVRFLAFFLVFLHHTLKPEVATLSGLLGLRGDSGQRILLAFINAGARGTSLFFALSAYLITDLLLQERRERDQISVGRFYLRRALRIWPLYFVAIAIGIGTTIALHESGGLSWATWYVLFAGNVYCARFGWPHNLVFHLWSISIEEQFYLLWPWTIRYLPRRGLLMAALLFIAGANCTLVFLGHHSSIESQTTGVNTFVQFEMFAVGILMAIGKKQLLRVRSIEGLLLALTGLVLWVGACFIFDIDQAPVPGSVECDIVLIAGYLLVALGCAAVLQGFCMLNATKIPRSIAYLGRISYGLYVFHILGLVFSGAVCSSLHGVAYLCAHGALALLITVTMAVLSYTYLESPFLRLKRKFEFLHSRPI